MQFAERCLRSSLVTPRRCDVVLVAGDPAGGLARDFKGGDEVEICRVWAVAGRRRRGFFRRCAAVDAAA
jgi:hypothetical protein